MSIAFVPTVAVAVLFLYRWADERAARMKAEGKLRLYRETERENGQQIGRLIIRNGELKAELAAVKELRAIERTAGHKNQEC